MEKKKEKKKTVGEEAYNILEKDSHETEVGEIINDYSAKYVQEMQKAVEINASKFESPFYIVVLHKKEPWALNVLRNYFIGRQTRPSIKTMWTQYKNYMHTVYECWPEKGELKLLYTLPSPEEAKTILTNWTLYSPDLVRWCHRAFEEMKEKDKIIL
jgi:hypothetical protein